MATVYAWRIDKDKYAYIYDEANKEPGYFGEEITGETLNDLRIRVINTFSGCTDYQKAIYKVWYEAMIAKIQATPGYEWVTFGDYSQYFCNYGACDSLIGPMGLPSMVDSTTTTMNVVDDNGDKIKDVPVKFSVARSVYVYDRYEGDSAKTGYEKLIADKGSEWYAASGSSFVVYRDSMPGDDGMVYFDGLGRLVYSADNDDAHQLVKNETRGNYYIRRAIDENENQYHVGIDLTWPNISRYVIVEGEEAQKISAGTVPADQYKSTPGAVYLVNTKLSGETNDFVEYVVAQKKSGTKTLYRWEKLGEHELLLTDYYTRGETDTINSAQTKALTEEITTKYNQAEKNLKETTDRISGDVNTIKAVLDEEDLRISEDVIAKDIAMRQDLSATTDAVNHDIQGVRNDLESANTRVINDVARLDQDITNRYNDLTDQLNSLSSDTVAEFTRTNESFTTLVANTSAQTITRLNQTATEIRGEVANASAETMSVISQKASAITMMVKDFSASTMSSIEETSKTINARVTQLSGASISEFADLWMTSSSITQTVANLSAGTEAQFEITSKRITSAVNDLSAETTSLVSQTASGITQTVAKFSGSTLERFSRIETSISGVSIDVANLSGNTYAQFKVTDSNIEQRVNNLSANTVGYINTTASGISQTVAELSGGSVSRFSTIETTLTGITEKVTNLSAGTEARFAITDTGITEAIRNLSSETYTLVNKTATGITETITQLSGGTINRFTTIEKNLSGVTIDVANLSGNTHSRFEQTETSITQQVQDLSAHTMGYIETKAGEVDIRVTQLSGNTVTQFSSLDTQIGNITARVTNLSAGTESRLSVLDNKIEQVVKSGETRASIVAKINDGTSSVEIQADNIQLTGDTGIAGRLSAYEGNIGNVNLKDGSIKTDNGNFIVDADGNMTATTATLRGSVTATGGTIGGIAISSDEIKSTNGNFSLTKDGTLTANSGVFGGSIKCTEDYTLSDGTTGTKESLMDADEFSISIKTNSGTNAKISIEILSSYTKDSVVMKDVPVLCMYYSGKKYIMTPGSWEEVGGGLILYGMFKPVYFGVCNSAYTVSDFESNLNKFLTATYKTAEDYRKFFTKTPTGAASMNILRLDKDSGSELPALSSYYGLLYQYNASLASVNITSANSATCVTYASNSSKLLQGVDYNNSTTFYGNSAENIPEESHSGVWDETGTTTVDYTYGGRSVELYSNGEGYKEVIYGWVNAKVTVYPSEGGSPTITYYFKGKVLSDVDEIDTWFQDDTDKFTELHDIQSSDLISF